ncbi:MAG: autotransporter-associated beta strand repeat-containing protein [Fuscovulum sp.]|nr:autotransporter-associated beta strand repeat-containing protein [Fuscovulum sp.]
MATWDGDSNTNFLIANNWVGNALPGAADDVILDNAAVTQPSLFFNTSITVASVTLSAGTFSLDGSLTAAGGVTVSGSGLLDIGFFGSFASLLTMNGGTTLNGGIIGAVTVNAGAFTNEFDGITGTLTVNGGSADLVSGSSSAALVSLGGTITVAGAVTGTTSISGGSVTLNTGANLADGQAVAVSGFGTLTVNAADTVGALSLSGGTIDGSAVLTASTFTQSGGDLAGAVTATSGATLTGGTISGTLAGGNATVQSGTMLVTGTVSSHLTLATGSRIEVDGGNLSYWVNVSGTLAGLADSTITGRVGSSAGGGAITAATGTTLTLASLNTHAPSVLTIGAIGESGTVRAISTNSSFGDASVSIVAGTLQIGGSIAGGFLLDFLSGTSISSGAALDIGGFATRVNNLSGLGTVTNSGADAALTLTGTSSFAGTIQDGAGTVSVTKDGAGTLTLSGTNTHTGLTEVAVGTLILSGGNAISDLGELRVSAPGVLRVDTAETVGALDGSGNITLNATLTSGQLGFATTASGVISGAGGMTVAGTGLLTLSGANTYSGLTTVQSGAVLEAASNGALGSTLAGTVVAAGGALQLTGGITLAEAISVSGTGEGGTGGAIRSISGNNVITGAITLAGASRINSDADQMDITGGISGTNRNLTFGGSGNIIVASDITTGSGTLTKDGTGIVLLGGGNSFTGATTVNGGTLQISGTGSKLSDTALVTVNSAGFLDLFVSETVGNIAGAGTITLITSSAFVVGNAGNSTFSGTIREFSAVGALTKQGTGTLTLSGTNTYTGTTTVTAGTLKIGAGGTTGTLGTGNVVNDAALVFDRSDATTVGNIISGTGTVRQTGAGTLTLSGVNTYSGLTTVDAGSVLRIGDSAALGSAVAGTVVAAGAALELTGGFVLTEAISAAGTGITSGGAIRNIADDNSIESLITLTGATRINSDSGTLTFTSGGITGTNRGLTFGGAGNISVFVDIVTGTGTLTKDGTGQVLLFGSNGFTGATTVNEGTLRIFGGHGLSDSSVLTINAPGTVIVSNNETVGNIAGDGQLRIGNGVTLTAGSAANSTFSGSIVDVGIIGALTKIGTGTLTLSGTNTYSGLTTVNGGVLRILNGAALGSATTGTTVVAGGALEVLGGISLAEAITVNGFGIAGGGALRTTGGTNTLTGLVTAGAAGGSVTANTGTTLNLTGGLATGSTALTLGGAGTINVGGAVSGAGGLTKAGAGTVNLTGGINHTGTTTVTAGTLAVSGSGTPFDIGGLVVNGGALSLDNAVVSVDSLTGTGGTIGLNSTGGASELTFGSDNSSGTYSGNIGIEALSSLVKAGSGATILSGVISGGGTVTATGSGTLTLSGTNTYTGTTTVTAGTLELAGGSAIANTGLVVLGATGTLRLTANETIAALQGSGTVDLGGRILVLADQATALGGLTLNGGAGDDGLSITLAASLQNLSLAGLSFTNWTAADSVSITGNALANRLTGSAGTNTLDGGLGNDTMLGGAGDDTYVVDATLDRVFETTTTTSGIDAGGIDTIRSSVTLSLGAYAGVSFVERLTLTGTANINGTGNALDNRLTGNAGNNILNGGLGNDTLLGGAGNDTYVVDAAGDRVFETTTTTSGIDAGGLDTVQSSITLSLDAYVGIRFVERLTLTGAANINGTGNGLANTLVGNGANNQLNGGLGNDTMTGGLGTDTFVFSTALGATNIDRITDFSVADDTIRLDDAVFAGLSTGGLAASAFAANLTGAASDALDRIIYETDTGRLYFDADGNGAGARIHFATLAANLALTNADFVVI